MHGGSYPAQIMNNEKNTLKQFYKIFDIPDFAYNWVDRFFEDEEIEMILLLAKKALSPGQIADKLSAGKTKWPADSLQEFIDRCFKRGIINRGTDGSYAPADFHARFEVWAMFEGWQDIPENIRQQLNAWEIDYYESRHAEQIRSLKQGTSRDPGQVCPEYLLLHEAESLIDRVGHVYLFPCNCRSMMKRCRQSVYTCLRFTNDRGLGWEISKYRAKEIVREANRNGLMQSGEVAVAQDGAIDGAICNCCPDCCYPHQLAERQDARKLWPLTRYVARHIKDRCTVCGRCIRRCPFGAFGFEEKENARDGQRQQSADNEKKIRFNVDLCRGCGICSTGCPEQAIEMVTLNSRQSIYSRILGIGRQPAI